MKNLKKTILLAAAVSSILISCNRPAPLTPQTPPSSNNRSITNNYDFGNGQRDLQTATVHYGDTLSKIFISQNYRTTTVSGTQVVVLYDSITNQPYNQTITTYETDLREVRINVDNTIGTHLGSIRINDIGDAGVGVRTSFRDNNGTIILTSSGTNPGDLIEGTYSGSDGTNNVTGAFSFVR